MDAPYTRLSHSVEEHAYAVNNDVLKNQNRRLRLIIIVIAIVNASVLIFLFYLTWSRLRNDPYTTLVYSPAGSAIHYRVQRFSTGLLDNEAITPFESKVDEERDAAWNELTNIQATLITSEEASRLTVPTISMPGNESWYIGGLDVFHQLHCLNLIRRALDLSTSCSSPHADIQPGISHDLDVANSKHLSHCINSIRQALMCQGDTSIVSWYQPEGSQKPQPRFDQPHVCRDFGKLKEWAAARKA